MSNTDIIDFSSQISAINSEINSSNVNPTTSKLLTKAKEIVLTFSGTPSKEIFNQILSQLNVIMTHLESTGYADKSVPNVISKLQEYLSNFENIEEANLLNNPSSSDSKNLQKLPQTSIPESSTTKEIGEIINQTIRNSVEEIVARINTEVSNKFSLITRQQYDSYSSLINESLNAASLDIVNQLSTLTQAVQGHTLNSPQADSISQKLNKTTTQSTPVAPAAKITTDTAKIMVEVGKTLQKNSKEMAEQSSYMNNISHEINSSIAKFKRSFNLKNFLTTIFFAWLFAGISCYFISSYIINNITKIHQYEQEHEAIQNLKVIKQNLDADGLKCWNKIFGK